MGVKISEMTELPVDDLTAGYFAPVAKENTDDNFKIDLGALAESLTSGVLLAQNNLSDIASAPSARENLGLEIGVDVMPVTPLYYGIGFYFVVTPDPSEILALHVAMSSFTLAANFAASRGSCGTNPTASFAIDVQKNGASIGTVTIATGGTFTFTTSGGGAKTVAAGDVLKFVAPSSSDATCANVAITLKGTL